MEVSNVESFSKLLQFSVSPVVLISGVGLLLLSVTNRLGRSIDRSRAVATELDGKSGQGAESGMRQLHILLRRAQLLRISVSLIVASVFFSCLMILFLFVMIFLGIHMEYAVLGVFCCGLFSLLGAMGYLLADVFLSLKALRIEVERHLD